MSHRAAEELSRAIDGWLTRSARNHGEGLAEIVDALAGALPPVADYQARERVRRRLATIRPRSRSSQEILMERALEEIDRLRHRLREDDYVPWAAVAAAGLVVVGALGLAVWLRRQGIEEKLSTRPAGRKERFRRASTRIHRPRGGFGLA